MHIVITSVDYADYLRYSLPAWKAAFPDAAVWVLTTHGDCTVFNTAQYFGAEVKRSGAFTRDGATFNVAAAHDEALENVSEGSIIAKVDADVVPHGKLPAQILPDTIYGCARYDESGVIIRPRSKKRPSNTPEECARRCLGFFQMFRYDPKRKFGSYPTAGKYDVKFANKFPNRVGLTDFYVTHLGGQDKRNWAGRTLPAFRSS